MRTSAIRIYILLASFLLLMGVGGFLFLYAIVHQEPVEECPPYWKCTPKGDWNDPDCKCWDNR